MQSMKRGKSELDVFSNEGQTAVILQCGKRLNLDRFKKFVLCIGGERFGSIVMALSADDPKLPVEDMPEV